MKAALKIREQSGSGSDWPSHHGPATVFRALAKLRPAMGASTAMKEAASTLTDLVSPGLFYFTS